MTRFTCILPAMLLLLLFCPLQDNVYAQERTEPELAEVEAPLTHRDFDLHNGAGLRLQLNNFGFAVGGEYRRVLSRYTKGIFEFQINTVKDESEQSFQDWIGYTVIPNKYNRIMAFPAMFGVSRRLFADNISDNFRFNLQVSGGPTAALIYPYYDHDLYGLGFRPQFANFQQQHYDPFQGWGEGEFIFGASGQISIAANIGGDFGTIQTVRIGYMFHYFPDAVQVMEPKRPGPNFFEGFDPDLPIDQQPPDVLEDAAGKQSFFGTPHITFVFGNMW